MANAIAYIEAVMAIDFSEICPSMKASSPRGTSGIVMWTRMHAKKVDHASGRDFAVLSAINELLWRLVETKVSLKF